MSTEVSLPPQVSPPEFALSALLPGALVGVEAIAYPVLPGDGGVVIPASLDELGSELGLDLLALLAADRATGKVGELTVVPISRGRTAQLLYLVGVGDQRPEDLRRASATLARAVRDRESLATALAAGAPEGAVEAVVVGTTLGSFGFHWRAEGPPEVPVARVVLAGLEDADEHVPDLHRAIAIGGAAWRSRMLAAVPSNVKSPAWLAEQAREIGATAELRVTVWDERELAKRGMGGLLGVGQASATPPRLIRLDYAPAKAARRSPVVVLVGKGITFDSGGLSIKPAESMTTMKRDMTGGGVVLSVMSALSAVRCPVRVVGLVAAAENAVSGNALRPGDVVRHYGGRTSEVTNTDAEGRLVLADALAFAAAELEPAAIVDIATLTGAMKVALGQRTGGLFATDDALADALLEAGRAAGEPVWRFPLVKDYEDKIASKVADADNGAGGAGAITAALFLKPFAGARPWAHLDIASAAESPDDRYEWTEGPTGFGARLLLSWLGQPDPLAGIGG